MITSTPSDLAVVLRAVCQGLLEDRGIGGDPDDVAFTHKGGESAPGEPFADEQATGTVVLPASRSLRSAHRRMRLGGQRPPERWFRTRPGLPSSGPAGRCSPESIETAELVCQVHFVIALVSCRGRLPHPRRRGSADAQAWVAAANDFTCSSAMSSATFIGATSRAVCASR
jgi:hypothetical protein